MNVIEIDNILQNISPESPSGENLEYDPGFLELANDIEGTPAVEVENRIVLAAKDPNWSNIRKSAIELLARSHDLQTAVFFTRAMLHLEGLAGLYAGIKLLHGFVESYWDTLYPRLDPDDGNDPTERVNIIESLSDWNTVIAPLMKVELCRSRTVSNINLRSYRIATGNITDLTVSEDEKESAPGLVSIEGAFAECDPEELHANSEFAALSLQTLESFSAILENKIGSVLAPDLGKLRQVVKEIHYLLDRELSARAPAADSAKAGKGVDSSSSVDEAKSSTGILGAVTGWAGSLRRAVSGGSKEESDLQDAIPKDKPPAPAGVRSADMVENREDVLRVLDLVCKYYEQYEPASPVPILVRRAMRLVEKNFLEIIRDLAPDSLAQIQVISGVGEEE